MSEPITDAVAAAEAKRAKKERKEKKAKAKAEAAAEGKAVETKEERKERKRKRKESRAAEEGKEAEVEEKEDQPAVEAEAEASAEAEGEGKEEDEGEEPEEVLSHKERRKRRRLEALAAQAASNAPAADSDSASAASTPAAAAAAATKKASAKPKRSPHSVWIGNLSFATTRERLLEWLEGHLGVKYDVDGKGEEKERITRVNMPKGVRKMEHNKGFAYVDLTSEFLVQQAVLLSEKNLDGRKLLIKSGSDFTNRPAPALPADAPKTKTAQKILGAQKNAAAPTLFVGNLSFESTEDGLWAMFERSAKRAGKAKKEEGLGEEKEKEKEEEEGLGIKKVRMGTFEDSGKCKGFAFVDFISVAAATAALVNPFNHGLDGRKLVLEYASEEAVRRGSGAKRKKPSAGEGQFDSQPQRERKPKRARPAVEAEGMGEGEGEGAGAGAEAYEGEVPRKEREREHKRKEGAGAGGRMKPGAALASAQRGGRETGAAVKSEGKKITFD